MRQRGGLKPKAGGDKHVSYCHEQQKDDIASSHQEWNKEQSEKYGEPPLWFASHCQTPILTTGRESSGDEHRPQELRPNHPEKNLHVSGRETLQRYSDPGAGKKSIMPRLRGMMRRGVGGLLLLISASHDQSQLCEDLSRVGK